MVNDGAAKETQHHSSTQWSLLHLSALQLLSLSLETLFSFSLLPLTIYGAKLKVGGRRGAGKPAVALFGVCVTRSQIRTETLSGLDLDADLT